MAYGEHYSCENGRSVTHPTYERCGVAVDENEKREDMCRTADTISKLDTSPGKIYSGLVTSGSHLCEITFSGRCASKTFRRDDVDDICLTVNTRALGYNEAVQNCEGNGGSLFVPDSDYDLHRFIDSTIAKIELKGNILDLIDGKITRFWFGGGSIFFRTCRDPSMGKNEEVAVQYISTENDDRYLGYATTRLTSDKAPYVCATSPSKKSGTCVSLRQRDPPSCSFHYVNIGKPGTPVYLFETCFPDGALKIGDKISMEGYQPDCCPEGMDGMPNASIYSINMFSRDKSPLIHLAVKRNWELFVLVSTTDGWGSWVKDVYYKCPFSPNAQFTLEIENTPNDMRYVLNGDSYTYQHPVANSGELYYSIGLGINRSFKVTRIAVIRNGKRRDIGLGAIDFTTNG